ncbi:uncharacterized protein LOC100375495 [Saccoglossus kowalevskii]|uniref:Uncharacterized protein LOC100375495 n=1 Tax=Saccoglossus kowalevskii TaxID=10224 RepID=A0ABM0GZS9_SACKO|nr:PREDICTED: uncharacterized protein LOC100375495 [Saccoglossus kowalevskii]
MANSTRVLLKVIVAVTGIALCYAQQSEIRVSTYEIRETVYGDTVGLMCNYEYPDYYKENVIITWLFQPADANEEIVIMSKTDDNEPLYYGPFGNRIEHTGSRGDILIHQVTLKEDGLYTCEVNFYLSKAYGEGDTELIVYYMVEFIDILKYNAGDYVWAPPGEPISFDCEGTRGKPIAELNWYLSNEKVPPESESFTENDDGTFDSYSTVVIVPTLSDHNAVLKCEGFQDTRLLEWKRKYESVVLNTSGVAKKVVSFVLIISTIALSSLFV